MIDNETGEIMENESLKISSRDQIKQICRVLGTPTSHDKSFMTDKDAIDYLEMTIQHKHKCKLEALFPSADSAMMNLLKGLLEFNPYLRLSAKQALQSPLFDRIRNTYYEKPS